VPALCGLLLLTSAAITAVGGKARPAATPEEAVANFNAAARAGDLEAMLAQVGGAAHRALDLELKFGRAHEAFEKALTEKFGKDPNLPDFGSFEDQVKGNMPQVEIRAKEAQGEGKALLTVWIHQKRFKVGDKDKKEEFIQIFEDRWPAMKEGGAWKVVPGFGRGGKVTLVERKGADGKKIVVETREITPEEDKADAEQVEYGARIGPKFLAAVDKIRQQVKDGKFKTREEARAAVAAAEKALHEQFPPPWLKKDEKKVDPKEKEIK
jgi:hypothetical protein